MANFREGVGGFGGLPRNVCSGGVLSPATLILGVSGSGPDTKKWVQNELFSAFSEHFPEEKVPFLPDPRGVEGSGESSPASKTACGRIVGSRDRGTPVESGGGGGGGGGP